jgi:hypothetical protein
MRPHVIAVEPAAKHSQYSSRCMMRGVSHVSLRRRWSYLIGSRMTSGIINCIRSRFWKGAHFYRMIIAARCMRRVPVRVVALLQGAPSVERRENGLASRLSRLVRINASKPYRRRSARRKPCVVDLQVGAVSLRAYLFPHYRCNHQADDRDRLGRLIEHLW